MANILTTTEAANALRCETSDAEMLALLPLVDAYIKNATGRDWTLDATIDSTAKAAARILLVQAHEDPGAIARPAQALSWGLSACLLQLEALALGLATAGVPDAALALVKSQPADGDLGVARAANLTLVFNHEMDSSVTSAVSLAAAGITFTVANSLDVTKKILTVNPTGNLAASTGYVLTLAAAADIYGQTLTRSISFTTAA